MPSPFPGMNPYLEDPDEWHSFLEWFCPKLAEAIIAKLPEHYLVRLDENVYLHELSSDQRRLFARPDVGVLTDDRRIGSAPSASTLIAPAYAQLQAVDLEKLTYIEIRDIKSRRLITVVELLSPSNKRPGNDRDQYLTKRARLMHENVNLVEIDLLRDGPRMPMDGLPKSDYLILVARPVEWPQAGVWPIGLRDPLPDIPIPLTPPEPDVVISLQTLLHAVYDAAGYDRYIYGNHPQPPLKGEDAAWATTIVANHRGVQTK